MHTNDTLQSTLGKTTSAQQPQRERSSSRVSVLIAGTVAALSGLTVVLLFRSHVITDAIHRMEGQVLVVEDPSRQVVASNPGESVAVRFPVRNISGETVTIFDAEVCCGDRVSSRLPLAIQASAESEVIFKVTAPRKRDEHVERTMQLLVDAPSPPIVLKVILRVAMADSDRISQ